MPEKNPSERRSEMITARKNDVAQNPALDINSEPIRGYSA
jgi:hypothetical protein